MSDNEKISEMQFDMFWDSIKKPGEWVTFNMDQLRHNFKLVWDKSRETFQSANGKKGGKAKGDCKRRDTNHYKKMNDERKVVEKICDVCGKYFTTNVPYQKRCSPECSKIKLLEYQRIKQLEYKMKKKKLDPDTK